MRLGAGGAGQTRNPKAEIRRKSEIRNPKPETRGGAARSYAGKIHRLALRGEVQLTGKCLSFLGTLRSRPNPEL